MWNARREIPEITNANIVDKVSSLSIDRGDTRRSVQHVGPFGGLVPVQLPNAAGVQAHIHASDFLGDAEFSDCNLTGPTAGFLPHMRVGERKPQVGKRAVIG